MKHSLQMACIFASAMIMTNCGKKSSDPQQVTSNNTLGSEIEVAAANALAVAYPGSLAISVFPQSDVAALALNAEIEDPNKGLTVQEKIVENQEKLKGEGDCLNLNQFRSFKGAPSVTCYEFDADMNPSRFSGGPTGTQDFGTVDGTNGSGEACLVTFTRAEVAEAVQTVDKALALISGMLCQAKKDGQAVEMPGVGEDLNLKASLENAAGSDMPVDKAEIKRMDDIDSLPVYRSEVTITDPQGGVMETHLIHSPGEDGTATGTLWFKYSNAAAGLVDPNNSANKNFVMSTNYSRVLDENNKLRMRFEVRRAAIVNTIQPFTDEGLVNYAGLPAEASNEQVHAINYVAFDMDPETNAGNLAYWQNPGGSLNESARGFLFNVEATADGLLKGCGISGATQNVSIRKALTSPSADNVLEPVRYWHPREDQNTHPDKDPRFTANEGNLITEQCFAQNAEGVYEIDTAKTAHERGYEVIAGSASEVVPPSTPKAVLEGEFIKP